MKTTKVVKNSKKSTDQTRGAPEYTASRLRKNLIKDIRNDRAQETIKKVA